jgi:DNA-binding transcriptional LysR family regulator
LSLRRVALSTSGKAYSGLKPDRLASMAGNDDLSIETLFHDELAVLCSRQNKWARRRNVSLADLVDEPWVFPHSTGFLTAVMRTAFEEQGLECPRATVITSSTYALSVLVGNGNFLGIHPRAMLATPNEHPQLTAVDVRLPTTRVAIGLIALKDRALSPVEFLIELPEFIQIHRTLVDRQGLR